MIVFMRSSLIYRLQSISLKWKLLIPFLLFSFVGTIALVYIGLTSQHELIKKEEKKEILQFYNLFSTTIDQKKEQALSLATVIAANPQVQKLLSQRDSVALVELLSPLYRQLKKDCGLDQFHFHIPPGKSFLRLHLPEEFGEMIVYRKAVIETMRTRRPMTGLEWGLSGLGLRGVVPVFHKGVLAGSIEIGFPFDKFFLDDLKKKWGVDFTVHEKKGEGVYTKLATTIKEANGFAPAPHVLDSIVDSPVILIAPDRSPAKSILLGPIKDCYKEVVALVEVNVDRSVIIKMLSDTRNLMLFVGLSGIFVSFVLIWLVASLFVRPIKEIVLEAQEIAGGKRKSSLHQRPGDEIGMLTHSLNTMLESLRQRRMQVQEYARNLETRVEERTADLVASEEKYRTLVENLPLIVYRVLDDGTTEFINPCFTQTLGYTAEEVVGDKAFWPEKICRTEGAQDQEVLRSCWDYSREFRVERVVRNKQGHPLTFIDQAIPHRDRQGKVKWIDGIMLDITELKQLQERAIRTEEIKVLGEISSRFAHEIRNPLATAGGFARRLRDSLPVSDAHRKIANIIVEEIARLEDILHIILSSIEPITLCISEVNLLALLQACHRELEAEIDAKRIDLVESFPRAVSDIQGDEGLLSRAFESLLENAIISMPEGAKLLVAVSQKNVQLVTTIRHRAEGLSEDDLEQFFFPRFTSKGGSAVLELPLAKAIIHRHGGKVDVIREDENDIVLEIALPIKSPDSNFSRFTAKNI